MFNASHSCSRSRSSSTPQRLCRNTKASDRKRHTCRCRSQQLQENPMSSTCCLPVPQVANWSCRETPTTAFLQTSKELSNVATLVLWWLKTKVATRLPAKLQTHCLRCQEPGHRREARLLRLLLEDICVSRQCLKSMFGRYLPMPSADVGSWSTLRFCTFGNTVV